MNACVIKEISAEILSIIASIYCTDKRISRSRIHDIDCISGNVPKFLPGGL
jgi:hypothetical protein